MNELLLYLELFCNQDATKVSLHEQAWRKSLMLPTRSDSAGRVPQVERGLRHEYAGATKYGWKKPIEITMSRNDEMAFLAVEDYGIGITKEDQEKIFHRFERVARSNILADLNSAFSFRDKLPSPRTE